MWQTYLSRQGSIHPHCMPRNSSLPLEKPANYPLIQKPTFGFGLPIPGTPITAGVMLGKDQKPQWTISANVKDIKIGKDSGIKIGVSGNFNWTGSDWQKGQAGAGIKVTKYANEYKALPKGYTQDGNWIFDQDGSPVGWALAGGYRLTFGGRLFAGGFTYDDYSSLGAFAANGFFYIINNQYLIIS